MMISKGISYQIISCKDQRVIEAMQIYREYSTKMELLK